MPAAHTAQVSGGWRGNSILELGAAFAPAHPTPPPPLRLPATEWSNSDKRIEGTLSSLSGCQASSLGFDDTNDMLIGGSGECGMCRRSWSMRADAVWRQLGVQAPVPPLAARPSGADVGGRIPCVTVTPL